MRATYLTAANVVTEGKNGDVCVNMAFDRDTPLASVRSFLPCDGRIEVTAKRAGRYMLRFPEWTERGSVKLTLNGEARPIIFGGSGNSYACADGILPGDTIALEYKLISFTQTAQIRPFNREPLDYTFKWLGNSVVSVEPQGKYLPVFGREIY